jgi:FMN phosphatase YigB (HAD superfamily)
MLGDFHSDCLLWLEEIGFRYKIYLFSNTNLIHYIAFQQTFQQATGRDTLDDYFIKAWYSHNLRMRKPYPESFRQLLELENLDAAETLFIDDTPKNIEGAKEVGLQTILLTKPMKVSDLDL